MALALKDDAWMLSPRGKANMTPNSQIVLANEDAVTFCKGCDKKFNVIIKKHHCRACGDVFCGQCSTRKTLLKGSRKVKQRMCDECTQYFQNEQLLVYPSIKIYPNGDKYDENNEDVFSDDKNKENLKQIESSSPKRSPLREISKDDNLKNQTTPLNLMTPLKSASEGIMSQILKSTFKMTTALKPIEEIKEEEKLDINRWTHSYTPPVNSPYVLSPTFTPNVIAAPEESIKSEKKVNRIATPESMINSPVVLSPETANSIATPESMINSPVVLSPKTANRIATPKSMINSLVVLSPETANFYTETTTFSSAIHIDTFRVMLASMVVIILASAGMMVPQKSVKLRTNDLKISTVPLHFEDFNYIEEIKYEIPEYTGDFSLSDPVHNRNQVGLFISNVSKIFKAFFDRIFGFKQGIIDNLLRTIGNLKHEIKSKLVHEMRSFAKVF